MKISFSKNKYFFLLLFLTSSNYNDKKITEFAKFVETEIAKKDIDSVVIAILSEKKILYKKVYSINKKINGDTLFRIGSISKFITSLLIDNLSRKKYIDINTPINYYDDKLKTLEHLSLKNLLSHTNGIPERMLEDYISKKEKLNLSILLKNYKNNLENNQYRSFFAYQNIFFNLISDILEHHLKKKIDFIFFEHLINPLDIKNFTVTDSSFYLSKNKALPHTRRKRNSKKLVPIKKFYPNLGVAGAMGISLNDSIKLIGKLLNGTDPFSKETLEKISSVSIFTCSSTKQCKRNCICKSSNDIHVSYGLGCRVAEYKKEKMIYHAGSLEGVSSNQQGMCLLGQRS